MIWHNDQEISEVKKINVLSEVIQISGFLQFPSDRASEHRTVVPNA